jgi:heptosyltransferase I
MEYMKIAIVKLSALGDIVHAMVVLQFIKKFNSDISIDWFVEESYKELLELHPDINKVYEVNLRNAKKNKSLLSLVDEFKKVRTLDTYDLVIDMQGLIKSAIISRLIPSIETIGFDKYSSRESFAAFFYNKKFKYNYSANVIERNLEIIKFALNFGLNEYEIKSKIAFLHFRKCNMLSQISKTKKNIVLIPGASHKSKCYPVEKFIELTSLIDANFIVIWGNLNEKKLANQIKSFSPKVNISHKLSINNLIELISKASLVIGPDTGPTHIAWALNIPSITIFGPTPGYRNTFSTKINKIIESDSKVDPFKIDKNDNSIKFVRVEDIVKISQKLLESPK